ncbi:ankyrin repeat domain-containing protein [bacterium]|nr:ankyrin repeat domain-containing protein [bacterium]
MKHILIIIIAAVVLVECVGVSKTELLKDEEGNLIILPVGTVPEAATPEPPRASIHRSARQGEIRFIIQHIDAGSDVNEVNKNNGQIALHYASTHNHVLILKLLIDNGSNVNLKDKIGMTSLHLTSLGGHKKAAKMLIDSGAFLNTINILGETPLDTPLKDFKIDSHKAKSNKKETADLIRKHGGKTGEEFKAEGK